MIEHAAPRLLQSGLIVSAMTLLSRFSGLARDVIIAVVIGAGGNTDAFLVAFRLPQFMRRIFAEGAFSQAFIPVLGEYCEQRSRAETQAFVSRAAGMLGASAGAVGLLASLGAPLLTLLFAAGFRADPDKFALTSDLLRITFPYLPLIALTTLAAAVQNTYGRFAVPAFTPALLNLSLIGAALFAAPRFAEPAFALAWGLLFAGFAQLFFQLPFLARLGMMQRPRFDLRHAGVRRVMLLMLPVIFAASVNQINLLADTLIASFLPDGSISWLYFSDKLMELPLALFAIAIATVIFPSLSRLHAASELQAFSATLDWALKWMAVLGVPASAALIILAEPLAVTLFQYGELQPRDAERIALSIAVYSAGLLALMCGKILAPGFFARQDTKTPVKYGLITLSANMLMNLLFVIPLHLKFELGYLGLAAATSAAAFLNAGLLFSGLLRRGFYRPQWRLLCATLTRAAVASALMGALLIWASSAPWLELAPLERAMRLSLLCAGGLACYLGSAWLLGLRANHLTRLETARQNGGGD